VREQGGEGRSFGWQNGYSAFTLAPSDMEGLMEYISRQEEHPRTTTFEEELRALLQAHGLEWDEKYGWD